MVIMCKKRVTDINYCKYYCKDREAICDDIIKKAIESSGENQQAKVVSCSDIRYDLLANYFRGLCMACDNQLHCDAKNFRKCFLKSKKWKTCPRDFWTEEMWNEAMKKIAENKEV